MGLSLTIQLSGYPHDELESPMSLLRHHPGTSTCMASCIADAFYNARCNGIVGCDPEEVVVDSGRRTGRKERCGAFEGLKPRAT